MLAAARAAKAAAAVARSSTDGMVTDGTTEKGVTENTEKPPSWKAALRVGKTLSNVVKTAKEHVQVAQSLRVRPEAWRAGGSQAARTEIWAPAGYGILCQYPDGSRLISVGSSNSASGLTIYEPDLTIVAQLKAGPAPKYPPPNESVAYSVATDGVHIAAGLGGGTICLWDAASLECLGPLPERHPSIVYGLALRDDILVSGGTGPARLWSLSQRCFELLEPPSTEAISIRTVSIDVDDISIATAEMGASRCARLWPRIGGHCRHTLLHPNSVLAVRLASDIVVTGCADQVVRVFLVMNGQLSHELKGHSGPVHSLALTGVGNHSGSRGMLLSGSTDHTVKVWSLDEESRGRAGGMACMTTLVGDTQQAVKGLVVQLATGRIASLCTGLRGMEEGELVIWARASATAGERQPENVAPAAPASITSATAPLASRAITTAVMAQSLLRRK